MEPVYHIIFAGHLFAIGLSMVSGVSAFLLYARYRNGSYRYFALYMAATILILNANAVTAYGRVVADDLSSIVAWISALGACGGSFLLAFSLPRVVLAVVNRPAPRPLRILGGIAVVPFCGAAAAARLGGSALFDAAWDILLIAYLMYCILVLIGGRERVESPALRSFLKSTILLSAFLAPLVLAQPFLRFAPFMPERYRDLPLPIVVLFSGIASISLVYALRNLFSPNMDSGNRACDMMIHRFGVSRRECEILQLLMGGRETKEIAEQLFISVHTVKNHIHSIYQKTGTNSKVQLLNIINNSMK